MSLETWKQEFYTEPAEEASKKDWMHCLEHSLKKWEGLRFENRNRHGTYTDFGWLLDCQNPKEIFPLASNCAPCKKATEEVDDCYVCPLFKVSGQACCANADSPWDVFKLSGDPEPMIALIKRAMEIEASKLTKNT